MYFYHVKLGSKVQTRWDKDRIVKSACPDHLISISIEDLPKKHNTILYTCFTYSSPDQSSLQPLTAGTIIMLDIEHKIKLISRLIEDQDQALISISTIHYVAFLIIHILKCPN